MSKFQTLCTLNGSYIFVVNIHNFSEDLKLANLVRYNDSPDSTQSHDVSVWQTCFDCDKSHCSECQEEGVTEDAHPTHFMSRIPYSQGDNSKRDK